MEAVGSIARWLFIDTIYGIALIAGAVYGLERGVKKVFPKAPTPGVFAGLAFFVALFTLPSIPRYQFEAESLAQVEGKGWVRVVNQSKWGSLAEPATWIRAPIGSMTLVMPNSPMEGGFRQVILRYDEKPLVSIIDPDCEDRTFTVSQPDSSGVFRVITPRPQEMATEELSLYCNEDWSKEKEALRQEFLRRKAAS